jgi:hypothetical protein
MSLMTPRIQKAHSDLGVGANKVGLSLYEPEMLGMSFSRM